MPQPDPSHPLTEFYCLLQRALDREGVFALPKKASETPKQGAPLYLASDNTLTTTSGTQFVGTAWADAQANDATVLCRINFGYGVAAAAAAAAAAAEQGS